MVSSFFLRIFVFMSLKKLPILFVFGPTAVGKTDFVEQLGLKAPIEIINMDSTQCYTPLTIGTAKHDWKSFVVPCHLFDSINEPRHQTVAEYRERALVLINSIQKRGNIPVFVGGSGFYLMSLLYPPHSESSNSLVQSHGSWDDLYSIDPERAQLIHKHDQYRINRALSIWHQTGLKPSLYEPLLNPPSDCLLLFLTRDRQELKDRIAARVRIMMKQEFIKEVRSLDTSWRSFVRDKKIIGYAQVLDYLESDQSAHAYNAMIDAIIQKTAAYAKRQETFWRSLTKKLPTTCIKNGSVIHINTDVINLTLSGLDLYIKQLLDRLLNPVN